MLTYKWIFSHTYSYWCKHTQTHMHDTITITTTNMWGENIHFPSPWQCARTSNLYCAISCKTNCRVGRNVWSPKNQERGIRRSAVLEKQLLSSGSVPRPLWHLPGQQAYFPLAQIPTGTAMVTEPALTLLSSEPCPRNNSTISSLH